MRWRDENALGHVFKMCQMQQPLMLLIVHVSIKNLNVTLDLSLVSLETQYNMKPCFGACFQDMSNVPGCNAHISLSRTCEISRYKKRMSAKIRVDLTSLSVLQADVNSILLEASWPIRRWKFNTTIAYKTSRRYFIQLMQHEHARKR